jgi:pimeloyl-ACP methyl ester carboxylesterase
MTVLNHLPVVSRYLTAFALALLVIATSPSKAAPPPQYFVDESKLPFVALPGARAYWGIHAGAGYRVEIPDNWNGDLVMWAHGFRGAGLELTVDNHPLRDLLVPLGYAWASSSYSRNDYDISSGVQSTHALMGRFNGLAGKPDRVYLTGASMGGHVTAVAIEQYPNSFDGALPICGVMADHALFDYFLDFNVASQQLGTGMSQYPVEPIAFISQTVPAIKANLEAVPGGWPVFLNAQGSDFKGLVEQQSGGDRPNFDEAWFFWNSFPDFGSGPGNFLFDVGIGSTSAPRAPGDIARNADTVYQFDANPALSPAEQQLNDDIARIEADTQTRRKQGLAQIPTVSGDISIPVLTLHNLGDLFVPVLNQVQYASRVAATGNSDLLVQRAIRGVLHCDFSAQELGGAFIDLVNWVENGAKPAGDNFSDPAEVASPDFGCNFTNGTHTLGTPCP